MRGFPNHRCRGGGGHKWRNGVGHAAHMPFAWPSSLLMGRQPLPWRVMLAMAQSPTQSSLATQTKESTGQGHLHFSSLSQHTPHVPGDSDPKASPQTQGDIHLVHGRLVGGRECSRADPEHPARGSGSTCSVIHRQCGSYKVMFALRYVLLGKNSLAQQA